MSTGNVEERLSLLEQEVADLKRRLNETTPPRDAWKKTFGMFADDDGFDELLDEGRSCRDELS